MAETSNGTTFTFDAAGQADVRSVAFTESADEIPITVLGSATHLSEAGLVKTSCSIETVGVSAIDVGDTGALAIAWNDGATESVADVTCLSKDATGSLDTEIVTTLNFTQSG